MKKLTTISVIAITYLITFSPIAHAQTVQLSTTSAAKNLVAQTNNSYDSPIVIPQSSLGLNLIGLNYYKSDKLPHDLTVNLTALSFLLFVFGALVVRGPEVLRGLNEWRLKNTAQKPVQPFTIPYLEL